MAEKMNDYFRLMREILEHGVLCNNRTGMKTLALNLPNPIWFDVSEGAFPLLTVRKIDPVLAIAEFIFLVVMGSRNERDLCYLLNGTRDPEATTFWTANVMDEAWAKFAEFPYDMGSMSYGVMMRNYSGTHGRSIDQVQQLIDLLKRDPDSRRLIVDMWHPDNSHRAALPPCHNQFEFFVYPEDEPGRRNLSITVRMRSWDVVVGGPTNIPYYAIMLHVIAHLASTPECVFEPYKIGFVANNAHIYQAHIQGAHQMLNRVESRLPALPTIQINHHQALNDYTMGDFVIQGYEPRGAISFEMF